LRPLTINAAECSAKWPPDIFSDRPQGLPGRVV